MTSRWAPGLVLVAAASCGAPELGPLARLSLSPPRLCEGQPPTAMILDGSTSLPAADGDGRLRYRWTLSRAAEEVVRGAFDEALLVVSVTTDRALGVSLQVVADSGSENRREEVVPLTRRVLRRCALGCAAGEVCTRVTGVEVCVTDRDCSDDSECDCLHCAADDHGRRLCLGELPPP